MFATISSAVIAVSTCSWLADPAVLARACSALPPVAAGAGAGLRRRCCAAEQAIAVTPPPRGGAESHGQPLGWGNCIVALPLRHGLGYNSQS